MSEDWLIQAIGADAVGEEVLVELKRAVAKFPPFNSAHEGLAVIWEEFEELKDHVWKNAGRTPAAREEAIQIAAMAMRYVLDLCENPEL